MDRVKSDIVARLKVAVSEAVRRGDVADGAQGVEIGLERPARPEHGDLATNAAMLIARVVRGNPRKIAEAIAGGFSTWDVGGSKMPFERSSARETGTAAQTPAGGKRYSSSS